MFGTKGRFACCRRGDQSGLSEGLDTIELRFDTATRARLAREVGCREPAAELRFQPFAHRGCGGHSHWAPDDGTAGTTGGFASVGQALTSVRAGLAYLAAADVAGLNSAEQADCLRGLAATESVQLAAAAKVLAAFDAARGYSADGQAGPKAWLRWQTRMTRPAAGAAMGWMRRLRAHPAVAAGLARAELSPSYARRICEWSDELPESARQGADGILVGAAARGLELEDLAVLFEEIRVRTAVPDSDGGDDKFGQRRLYLDRHFHGHASLSGELTPQAAEAFEAVLDSLGKRAGPEDLRTKAQRDHDALEEACRRLIASGCLPEVAGQPVHINLLMSLSQLLGQAESDLALAAETAATGTPVPPGAECDAAFTPVVTGSVDHHLLDRLAGRYLGHWGGASDRGEGEHRDDGHGAGGDHHLLDRLAGRCLGDWGEASDRDDGDGDGDEHGDGEHGDGEHGADGASRGLRAARQLTIAEALRLLSGPVGLAAQLRTGGLAGPPATISLPLDIGRTSHVVPPHLRRAIARRDRRCRFPGCDRRPRACQVHHLVPWSEGGETSLSNCCLLCPFHHLVVIHRWGWRLTMNSDGTATAVSPDGHTLHSHAPPAAA